jgi:hypothetical protein
VRIVSVALVVFALAAGTALASRQPTFKEREAITAALPAFLRTEPVACVYLQISVATNGMWAIAQPEFLNATTAPCARYAANGYWLLKRTTRWKVVYNGSEQPPCTLGAPKDLTACVR